MILQIGIAGNTSGNFRRQIRLIVVDGINQRSITSLTRGNFGVQNVCESLEVGIDLSLKVRIGRPARRNFRIEIGAENSAVGIVLGFEDVNFMIEFVEIGVAAVLKLRNLTLKVVVN